MRLLFLGDICLAGATGEYAATHPDESLCDTLKEAFAADFVIANIENALTQRTTPLPCKWATLKSDPKTVSMLRGIDIGVISNNHVGDFGPEGARDTLKNLNAVGIRTVGWGETAQEASAPIVIRNEGSSVALVALSCLTTNGGNYASRESPGVSALSNQSIEAAILEAKTAASTVVAYLHWGIENDHYPTFDQMRLARHAVRCGAAAIVGTHAHVIQGWETYNGAPIFYGLGNFAFGEVPCQWYDRQGTKRMGFVHQERINRQSIGCLLKTTNDGNIQAAEIYAFEFDPSSCATHEISLTATLANMNTVNTSIAKVADRFRRELEHEGDQEIRARGGPDGIVFNYKRLTISHDSQLSRSYGAYRLIGTLLQKASGRKW